MREVARHGSLVSLVHVSLAVVSLFLMSLLCLHTAQAAERAYDFTTEDIPLHYTFQGQPRDDIVWFIDTNSAGTLIGTDMVGDGFLLTADHQVTEFHCPGDVSDNEHTSPFSINTAGFIVGYCPDGVSPEQRLVGFVRAPDRTMTLLAPPSATYTIAYGINDLGDVVGTYIISHFPDALPEQHGFLWKAGVYTSFDAPFPDTYATAGLAINDAGEIVGSAVIRPPGAGTTSETAFLYDQVTQTFTVLAYPGATTTAVMDINNDGLVLGEADLPNSNQARFLYEADSGQYWLITDASHTVLDPSDTSRVYPPAEWGLSDEGALVGTYTQKVPCATCGPGGGPFYRFVLHSFTAVPTPPVAPAPPASSPTAPTSSPSPTVSSPPLATVTHPPPGPSSLATIPPAPSPAPPVVVVAQPVPPATAPQEPAPPTTSAPQDPPPMSPPPETSPAPVVMAGTTGGSVGGGGGCTVHPGAGVDPVLPAMGGVILVRLLWRRRGRPLSTV
jgi:hypothetical protein